MTETISEPIIEGFICPNCMKSFGTADLLTFHFNSDHKFSHSTIQQNQEQKNRVSSSSKAPGSIQSSLAFYDQRLRSQSFGGHRSLTSQFIQIRRSRVARDAFETNSLLIRLEKLTQNAPTSSNERRDFEQSVVPWIDAKVDLCPSCGRAFGLGVELAVPIIDGERDDDTVSLQVAPSHMGRLEAVARRSKQKITQFTNAILDYNPVYRRRHHCRLCGHVLCADCSFFLSKMSASRVLEAIDAAGGIEARSTFNSVTSGVEPESKAVSEPVFLKATEVNLPLIERDKDMINSYMLRVCNVCKDLLERKMDRLQSRLHSDPLVRMHTELRKHMDKVLASLPAYTEIAESLHSGEQRYALEVAKNMRHDLLESLQNIDLLRRKFEDLVTHAVGQNGVNPSGPINLASIRLARTIAQMARQFLQTNLPPLRALPTLQQYDSLAAQRKDELAARWEEEDRALAQLEQRVATAARRSRHAAPFDPQARSSNRTVGTGEPDVEKLKQLATAIDTVSSRLMSALSRNDSEQARRLQSELSRLEREFQMLSTRIQSSGVQKNIDQ